MRSSAPGGTTTSPESNTRRTSTNHSSDRNGYAATVLLGSTGNVVGAARRAPPTGIGSGAHRSDP